MTVVSLKDLLVLDLGLNALLLQPSLVWDSPPYWAFVFASNVEVHAGTASGVALVTLLPAKATSKATYQILNH